MRNKKRKINHKKTAGAYYVAAACFYFVVIIEMVQDRTFNTMYMCLGSAMLCLGAVHVLKQKQEEKAEEEQKDKES